MTANEAAFASFSSSLIDRLAEELGARWRAGERPLVEEYLALYPELLDEPGAAVELIYEELCLRGEFGEEPRPSEILRRFPMWHNQLRAIFECHHFLETGMPSPGFPRAGEAYGDFRLLAELGRGGQGRVFLATQSALADRPVVLKFAPRSGHEHLALARLQHTHIVPLHAVQDDPSRNLRVLCMPYFGGVTLAQLQELLRETPPGIRTGRLLLEALRRTQMSAQVPLPPEGPICQFLARAPYLQAVCWMGACLADALQYTHERGLVHLDLKPANVLWAADGQPMLLDLHLARGPVPEGVAAPAWLGGTPAYMAPEHQQALAAVRTGQIISRAVDGRADVFALGLLLCEALGGATPPRDRTGSWLRQRNPQVTVGLADILDRCLAVHPRQRYPEAGALADDLRRHLAHLPLRGVPNRSLAERWRKWRFRWPHGPVLLGLALAGAAAAGLALGYIHHEGDKARAALAEGQEHMKRREYGAARAAWQRGLDGAEGLPFHRDLTEKLRGELRLAEQVEVAQDLHRFSERVRSLYGADGQPVADVRAVESHCRAFWQKRDLIVRRLGAQPDPEQEQVRIDLLDLAILWTDLRVRLADRDEAIAVRREALEVLDQAETLFGPSCVLEVERSARMAALGIVEARARTAPAPRTAWEHYAIGRAQFRAGHLEAATGELDQAVALQPQALWPNFYLGACAFRRSRFDDAILAFTACTVLAPESAWCFHNRGLAYDALGQLDRARSDYDHALRLDPLLVPAALSRAMLQCRLGDYHHALDDLELALNNGADPALVNYDRALVYLAQGDQAAALASLRRTLERNPDHEPARSLANRLQRHP